ncbi:DUF3231 family protein [Paenibacillus oryzisoli]|uniref:DUF3231 family protein n=1 Tax=Paenibacillus oryzisoli TaxID=1850517 RepID=UPI003D2C3CF0
METSTPIKLTASELGTLWTTYINDTMAKCILSYFFQKAEDLEIKHVVESALRISVNHLESLKRLFKEEDFPIPQGFTDHDVNVHAKRLFSDSFSLYYLKNMSKVGITTFGVAFSMATRADIRAFFHDCTMHTIALDQKVTELLLAKGLYVRPPSIPTPHLIEFVSDKSFLSGGFFGFGDKRPLLSIEIAQLFSNIHTNALGKALLMGFSQVVKSPEIHKYFITGKEISSKHVKVFSDVLLDDDIPTPMTWDADVSDSTDPPFSDKLMLFHVSLLIAAGTANYGVSAAACPRKDLATSYVRLAAEIATYAENGALLMIKNSWLEEPPQNPDRDALRRST